MKLICVLLTAFALGATPAYADSPPKYEVQIVPKCKLVKDAFGVQVCAYTLKEWQEVSRFDAELVSKRRLLSYTDMRFDAIVNQKTLLIEQIKACSANQALLIKREDKLVADIIAKDKELQYERVKPRWGNPVAWTVAAVSAVLLVGYVGRDVLN